MQLAYAIGVAEPVSVMVDTFGTATVSEEKITSLIREFFSLTPKGIIEALDLRRPIYKPTAAYGHFGRTGPGFTWELTDRADALRKAAGLGAAAAVPAEVAARSLGFLAFLAIDSTIYFPCASFFAENLIKEHSLGYRRTEKR